MIKIVLFLPIYVFITFSLTAQRIEFMLIPFEKDGLWGYVNAKKEVVVKPQFEAAFPTHNSRGRVKKKGKYGFIDNEGNWIVKPKFTHAEDFSHGIAAVRKKKKEYYLKTNGKKNKDIVGYCGTHYCIYPRMRKEYSLVQGENGKWGLAIQKAMRDENQKLYYLPDTIAPQFDTIVPVGHQILYLRKGNKIALVHDGHFGAGSAIVVKELKFDYNEVITFLCESCCTGRSEYIALRKENLWGFGRVYGEVEELTEFKYLSITPLERKFSLVEYTPNKWGYIDSYGNEYFNF